MLYIYIHIYTHYTNIHTTDFYIIIEYPLTLLNLLTSSRTLYSLGLFFYVDNHVIYK